MPGGVPEECRRIMMPGGVPEAHRMPGGVPEAHRMPGGAPKGRQEERQEERQERQERRSARRGAPEAQERQEEQLGAHAGQVKPVSDDNPFSSSSILLKGGEEDQSVVDQSCNCGAMQLSTSQSQSMDAVGDQ